MQTSKSKKEEEEDDDEMSLIITRSNLSLLQQAVLIVWIHLWPLMI